MSFDLHVLAARLDRAADRILRTEYDVSYRRFLALVSVGELGAATQRELAERLGVSEPSASRMTGVLVQLGLLDSQADPGGGNRRRLSLSAPGRQMLRQCRTLLEHRFTEVVERSGVSYRDYAYATRLLIDTLSTTEQPTDR